VKEINVLLSLVVSKKKHWWTIEMLSCKLSRCGILRKHLWKSELWRFSKIYF